MSTDNIELSRNTLFLNPVFFAHTFTIRSCFLYLLLIFNEQSPLTKFVLLVSH